MIYYEKRHRGKVFINGVEAAWVTHCDTVLGYAVRYKNPFKAGRSGNLQTEVVRGSISFERLPKAMQKRKVKDSISEKLLKRLRSANEKLKAKE